MKDIDPVADFKKKLQKRPATEMTVRLIQCAQEIDLSAHPNQLQAFRCLESCVECFDRGDAVAARLLYWISGALVNDSLCLATWVAIDAATQSVGVSPRHD